MPPTKTVDLAPSTRPRPQAPAPAGAVQGQGPRLTKDAPLAVRLAAVTTQVWGATAQHQLNLKSIRAAAKELDLNDEEIENAFVASNPT